MGASDLHPIQVAARRSGLKVETIRVWERRYRAVTPERDKNQRRHYRDEDIERLRLLSHATRAGRRISDLASLSSTQLAELVEEDEQAALRIPADRPARPRTESVMGYFDGCLEALEGINPARLSRTLDRASKSLAEPTTQEDLIVPLVQHVRDECRQNHMRMAHELLLLSVVRAHMMRYAGAPDPEAEALPRAVVAGLFRQTDDLPLLRLAVAARAYGWQPVYLGANLTADEIAWTAVRSAALCTLASCDSAQPDLLPNELRKIRRATAPDHPILLFGADADVFRPVIDEEGLVAVPELVSLRIILNRIRAAAGRKAQAGDA